MMSPSSRDRDSGDAKIVIDDLVTKKVQVAGVHPNVQQEVILITEDKVRLCLNANFQRAARSRQWVTVGGMILTFLLTLTTAEFRDFAGLRSQEWRGVMIAALALACCWFLVSLRWAMRVPTIDQIVFELKEGSQKIAQEDRVLSLGDEEVIVVQRRPSRPPLEELGGVTLDTWANPLRSPIPEDLRKALIIAMQTYRTALATTPNPADTFLYRRDIGNSARESLRLGYAPEEWDYLLKKCQGVVTPATLVKAGLAHPKRSAAGGYYDLFRGRVIVPVEYKQALCGFIGVSIEGTDPVLLFSPDTAFFTSEVAVEYARSVPELRVITGL
jgi:hypothetical protein